MSLAPLQHIVSPLSLPAWCSTDVCYSQQAMVKAVHNACDALLGILAESLCLASLQDIVLCCAVGTFRIKDTLPGYSHVRLGTDRRFCNGRMQNAYGNTWCSWIGYHKTSERLPAGDLWHLKMLPGLGYQVPRVAFMLTSFPRR